MKATSILLLISFSLNGQDYQKSILDFQADLNQKYSDPAESPLTADQLKTFTSHDYFEIDENYNIQASFDLNEEKQIIKMETSTSRRPSYLKYGTASLKINDQIYKLTIYKYAEKLALDANEEQLFLPFKDYTNGDESYGGGRYIDLSMPVGNVISIDFNKSYNPYCAYNDNFSCPVPPFENHLNVAIPAGIKGYTKTTLNYDHGEFEIAAKKLFTLTKLKKNFIAGLSDSQELKENKEYSLMFAEEVSHCFDEFESELTEIYAEHFSLEELNEILEFYESDLGKKYVNDAPIMQMKIAQFSAAWGEGISKLVRHRMDSINNQLISKPVEECELCKIGNFDIMQTDGISYQLTRTRIEHIEDYDGFIYKYSIEWNDDCTYRMVSESEEEEVIIGSIIEVKDGWFKFVEKNTTYEYYLKGEGKLNEP